MWVKSRLVRLMDIAETEIAQNQHTIEWRVDDRTRYLSQDSFF